MSEMENPGKSRRELGGLTRKSAAREWGLDQWRLTQRFTLHMSVTGSLCATSCSTAQLMELVVEGSTQIRAWEITGFARANLHALYRLDWVALERQDAGRVMGRQGSP
jgi:hypothetical protein